MRAEPRSFQVDAVQHHVRLLNTLGASAEASVPGFGKTFVASFVAREMNHELVVACPKSVIPHWVDAAGLAGAKVRCISNYEQHKLGHAGTGRWAIKNRRWQWTFPKPTLLVLDEGHCMKTRSSQNAKFAIAAKRQGIPTMVMSATLAVDPTDLYATGFLLGLHSGDEAVGGLLPFRSWQLGYGVLPLGFDLKFCPQHDPTALARLHAELFPKRGHRKTYDEIPGFPPATTDVRAVLCDSAALEKLEAAWTRTKELEALHRDAPTAAVARQRARQLAELAKVPAMVELARDLVASGLSVPIFVEFHDTVDALQRELGCKVIDGRTPAADREAAIARFQCNMDRDYILVLQTATGGVGISLHDIQHKRPRHGIYSPGDNAVSFVQALGRIRRDGGTPCFRTILTLAGSIEQRVHRRLNQKIDQIDTINDGDLDPLSP